MIQLNIFMWTMALIGGLGLALYTHYRTDQQQPQLYGSRRRRSLTVGINTSTPSSRSERPATETIPSCGWCCTDVLKNKKVLKCGHCFHQECIHKWFQRENNICPTCEARAF